MDVGSGFCAQFEEACNRLSIRLVVLPPSSPNVIRHAERAQRAQPDVFCDIYGKGLEMVPLNQARVNWDKDCNIIGPHQCLGFLIPIQCPP